MIQKTQLMIGDIVKARFTNGTESIVRVHEVRSDNIMVVTRGMWPIRLTALEPVPLTPEILKKNGFRYERDYSHYMRSVLGELDTDNYVSVGWNTKDEMYCYEVVTPTRTCYGKEPISINELQHKLRDCKLNKLADNFKY